jgi:curved DNA-binding protein
MVAGSAGRARGAGPRRPRWFGMEDDYYQLLDVARDATSQDIKRAFREIARKCHPDVSGGDPELEERFKRSRLAYETLMDPVARARYDRRAQRKSAGTGAPPPGGSFFDAFWKASEKTYEKPSRVNVRAAHTGRKNPGNDVSLDDLFDGWGRGTAPPPAADPADEPDPRSGEAPAGRDVYVELEVPADVARDGGSVTTVYHRMQRSDAWRPGSPDAGVVRIQDLAEIRIIPGTRNGEVLRERGLGDVGAWGGPPGDLICSVRIVAGPRRAAPPPTPAPPPRAAPPPRSAPPPPAAEPPPAARAEEEPPDAILDISVVEALLGGRVTVETPQGRVRATIPPCTSSGMRMRLKGKGPAGADGQPVDWFVVTRIVVPATLDAESRRLIEEFARLNP